VLTVDIKGFAVSGKFSITQVFENLTYVAISTGDGNDDSFHQIAMHIPAFERIQTKIDSF